MIDVKLLRENPEPFYDSARKRGFGKAEIDKFFTLDKQWRSILKEVNDLRKDRNAYSLRISELIKKKEPVDEIKNLVRKTNASIAEKEEIQKKVEDEREEVLSLIPNVLHDSVYEAKGDENNQFIRFDGKALVYKDDLKEFLSQTLNTGSYDISQTKPVSHVDLEEKLDIVDLERAAKISGSRFYFLKNRLLKLELALINYGIDFLSARGFTTVSPPFMMNYDPLSKATDIETFKESLYKLENDDLYLISTSEHPIAAMLKDEILDEIELPIRVAGLSPCFRREAGAHGKDTKGIFRVHHFYKVEQFVFCKPEHSWDFHEELTHNTEDLLRSLNIPFRVVSVCSGELSRLNAKKYDIEAWYPSQGKFREVASSSNNTDFQARSLNIRYRTKDGNRFVHTINNTGLATTRIMVCIMENFQTAGGGIKIPNALIPYTGFDEIN